MYDISQPGFRDAVHVPFIMVTCPTALHPGDKCSLRQDGPGNSISCVKWGGKPEGSCDLDSPSMPDVEPMWHGVADPFREQFIKADELFALYLRKECFRRLQHVFEIEVHDRDGTSTCHEVCDIF